MLVLAATMAAGQDRVPPAVAPLFERAYALWQQDKCGDAVPLFEKIVHQTPDFAEPYFCLGFCYTLAHTPAKAEQALRRYVLLEPRAADGWAALAVALLDGRQIKEARTSFEKALELDPRMERARKQLLRLLIVEHDYRAAAPHAGFLLSSPAPDEEAYALATSAYLGLGAGAKALQISEKGLEAHEHSSQLERLHLAALLDCGRDRGCGVRLVDGLNRQARSATSVRTSMTVLQDAYSRGVDARRMVEQALSAYPDAPAVQCLSAQWELVNRRYRDAIFIATKTASGSGLAAGLRAQCLVVAALGLEQERDLVRAERAAREAEAENRALTPPNPGISMVLIDLLANSGQTAEALEALRTAMRWSADFGPARLRLAKLLGGQNQQSEAVQEAEAALRLGLGGDEERSAHAFLASAYFTLGNDAQAAIHEKWIAAHQPARP